MRVLMFQSEFIDRVRNGSKRMDIRKTPKVPVKIGEELSLRAWSGRPYRSSMLILRKEVCSEVDKIWIGNTSNDSTPAYGIVINGTALHAQEMEALARLDGFDTWEKMFCYFGAQGFPFEGSLILW